MCVGDIVAVKNSFFHTHISGADEFTPPERAEIELLSGIESGFRIEDQTLLGPFRGPSLVPRRRRAGTCMRPHEDVVTFSRRVIL
jgi:hypothetical protein